MDWLRVEFGVNKAGVQPASPHELSSDEFVGQVRGRRKHLLTSKELRALRREYKDTVVPLRECLARVPELERIVRDAVNEAYGLTDEEVKLLWKTAPPRMPIPSPLQPQLTASMTAA